MNNTLIVKLFERLMVIGDTLALLFNIFEQFTFLDSLTLRYAPELEIQHTIFCALS